MIFLPDVKKWCFEFVASKVFLFSLVCGGKISDGKDHIEDNIADIKSMVKSIKSLVQW